MFDIKKALKIIFIASFHIAKKKVEKVVNFTHSHLNAIITSLFAREKKTNLMVSVIYRLRFFFLFLY